MSTTSQKSGLSKYRAQIPARFQTARTTLFIDRFMTHFIKFGGIGIIATVFGIFIFIFAQIIPLFQGAKVEEVRTVHLPEGNYRSMGTDEWGEKPFVIDDGGNILFVDGQTGKPVLRFEPEREMARNISAFHYSSSDKAVIYGTDDGTFAIAHVNYEADFSGEQRVIRPSVELESLMDIGDVTEEVIDASFGGTPDGRMVAAILQQNDRKRIEIIKLARKRSLLGAGELKVESGQDVTSLVRGNFTRVIVNSQANAVIVLTDDGSVHYLAEKNDKMVLRQVFQPFSDLSSSSIASADYLLGGVSLIFTSPTGANRIYSLFIPEGETKRLFGRTKSFEPLQGGSEFSDVSLRNKAFIIGSHKTVSLRYATSESVRWEKTMPFEVQRVSLGRKYKNIFMLDTENRLHEFSLEDHHPEAGFKAFFSKIWYEGYSKPVYQWQSTGGTDEFEPKLSLIPLIIGTMKGTFYAMIFALPIAVLAAIYTAQFAHPRFKTSVKPLMEIMASLPSVVLGFLAALWLAPIIETKVPSLMLILVIVPGLAFLAGALWTRLPTRQRNLIPPGYEWIPLIPLLIIGCYIGWMLGPVFEKLFFVVQDPATGQKIADFRLWWPHVTGTPFEQRNSLVVGFIMGFAVIPIIFTISEDALSNVPKSLVSGSLALGASRWQTALRVVVPTAIPGIFSAVMIGLGRAIGETMIVVMATGNTAIMDFNIFSGMRTLSANIAVELPEAPYMGTLYRTLFLGAMVLFMMTFVMNTVAEIIRQRLREKYRTV